MKVQGKKSVTKTGEQDNLLIMPELKTVLMRAVRNGGRDISEVRGGMARPRQAPGAGAGSAPLRAAARSCP